MMRSAVILLFALGLTAHADNLTLRDGTRVSGSWIGGDRGHISFMVENQVRTYARSEVSLVTFGQAPAAVPADLKPPVAVGQTIDQVEGSLGKPAQSFAAGGKRIYVYKDPPVKITFQDGKVADVE
jgi:hypothetical protein